MRILIVGATGHNGAAVARRLSAEGHHVSGLVRDPARAPDCLDAVHVGDVVTGAGLAEATAGADVAYYFVHSLDSRAQDGRDIAAARNFAGAATAAEVRRAVFFTTLPVPGGVRAPRYQRNRQAVEDLFTELSELTVVRAGMVLGDRSRGMRPYVQLVHRAPMIPMGPWRTNRIAVVDSETVAACLSRAGTSVRPLGRHVDVPASAEPTHEELFRAVMRTLGQRKPIVRLPRSSPALDAFLASRFTDDSYHFSRHLASINSVDYRVDPACTAPFADVTPLGLDDALRAALGTPRTTDRTP